VGGEGGGQYQSGANESGHFLEILFVMKAGTRDPAKAIMPVVGARTLAAAGVVR
jgi:hypothetical protein